MYSRRTVNPFRVIEGTAGIIGILDRARNMDIAGRIRATKELTGAQLLFYEQVNAIHSQLRADAESRGQGLDFSTYFNTHFPGLEIDYREGQRMAANEKVWLEQHDPSRPSLYAKAIARVPEERDVTPKPRYAQQYPRTLPFPEAFQVLKQQADPSQFPPSTLKEIQDALTKPLPLYISGRKIGDSLDAPTMLEAQASAIRQVTFANGGDVIPCLRLIRDYKSSPEDQQQQMSAVYNLLRERFCSPGVRSATVDNHNVQPQVERVEKRNAIVNVDFIVEGKVVSVPTFDTSTDPPTRLYYDLTTNPPTQLSGLGFKGHVFPDSELESAIFA